MGIVYKARHPATGRLVALKIPPGGADFAARFEREASVLASLEHPNIVACIDHGREGDRFFLAMEYVDGASLGKILRGRRLSLEETIRLMAQLCDALEYAHGKGVVHRDIKPENLLIDKEGRLKLADFGVVKLTASESGMPGLTQTGAAVGTAHYAAPEQIESAGTVDPRADVYSAGVVLYEILTGVLPVGRFEPPSRRVALHPAVDDVVLKALARNPEERYATAGELKAEVLRTLALRAPVGRRRLPLFVGAASILLAAIVGLFFHFVLRKKSPPSSDPRSVVPTRNPLLDRPQLFRELRAFPQQEKSVYSVAISPDGTVVAGIVGNSIKRWKVVDGVELPSLGGTGAGFPCMALNPDGSRLAAGDTRGVVMEWDTATARLLGSRSLHRATVKDLAYSPDGRRLVSLGGERTLAFWDSERSVEVRDHFCALRFSPDGRTLALAGGDANDVALWSLAESRILFRLPQHDQPVQCVAFSPDGKLIASGGDDARVRLWNAENGTRLRTLSGHVRAVYGVVFSGDGSVLFSGGQDGIVRVWRVADGHELASLKGHRGGICALAIAPRSDLLVTGGHDRVARLWGLRE